MSRGEDGLERSDERGLERSDEPTSRERPGYARRVCDIDPPMSGAPKGPRGPIYKGHGSVRGRIPQRLSAERDRSEGRRLRMLSVACVTLSEGPRGPLGSL
jgi:hypothetical protein